MKTTAAVLVETGRPLELCDLEIPQLQAGQALIEIAFSGVCHTQLLECKGLRGDDRFLPHCLGHEGSGTVLDVGEGVQRVRAGDQVILSWIKGSGADVPSVRYDWSGRAVNSGAITTFSRHAIISENRLTPIACEIPLPAAALVGCAIPTGAGVVFNTAQAQRGDSIVVFGCGGVGLCAVAAAAVAGCATIIAVEPILSKLEIARQMGATHTLCVETQNPLEEIAKICPQGVHIAIEATGRTEVMEQALRVVQPRGGRAVVVGNARFGARMTLDPLELNLGKKLLGTWGGDSDPDRDYDRYCSLVASDELKVSPLLDARYPLEDVNQALDDLEHGRVLRPILDMAARS